MWLFRRRGCILFKTAFLSHICIILCSQELNGKKKEIEKIKIKKIKREKKKKKKEKEYFVYKYI